MYFTGQSVLCHERSCKDSLHLHDTLLFLKKRWYYISNPLGDAHLLVYTDPVCQGVYWDASPSSLSNVIGWASEVRDNETM